MLEVVLDSFHRLSAEADLILVEGAGSPAEINLRERDIANMGFARASGTPVALVGDIDRGHVIAALVGAHAVLDVDDRAMIKGFLINRFRGDPALFDEGRRQIARRTGWSDLGMAPWLAAADRLPAEDAVVLERGRACSLGDRVRIARAAMANLGQLRRLRPLNADPAVDFAFVPPGRPLPADADLIVLPGSKATLSDLAMMRSEGWDIDLMSHVRHGGRVLGLCGGYQMLGRRVADPLGIEGAPGSAEGLGLLDVETTLGRRQDAQPGVRAPRSGGQAVTGYEIHLGETTGAGAARPFLIHADGRHDGAVSPDGRVAGSYVHGLFRRRRGARRTPAPLGVRSAGGDHSARVERPWTILPRCSPAPSTSTPSPGSPDCDRLGPLFEPPAIAPVDSALARALRAKIDGLAKPPGALGDLEDLAVRIGLIQSRLDPAVDRVRAYVFAATTG